MDEVETSGEVDKEEGKGEKAELGVSVQGTKERNCEIIGNQFPSV